MLGGGKKGTLVGNGLVRNFNYIDLSETESFTYD